MKRTFYTGFGKDNFKSVSDNKSSNTIYLKNYGSKLEETPTSNLPDATNGITPTPEPIVSQTVGSKRSSDEPARSTRRPRRKGGLENLNKLLVESNRNVVVFKEMVERSDPYTMADCLHKLGTMENLTTQALLAVQDALKENKDNKAILMTWEGEVLHKWIEYIVENHPRFYASKIWQ